MFWLRACFFFAAICLLSACRLLYKERVDLANLLLYADTSQLSGIYVLDCLSSKKTKGGKEFYVNGSAIGLFKMQNDSLLLSESFDTTAFSSLCGRVVFDCERCACAGMPPCAYYETAQRRFVSRDCRGAFKAQIPATRLGIDSFSEDKSRVYVAKFDLYNTFERDRTLKISLPQKGAIFYLARPSIQDRQQLNKSLGGDCEFRACEHCPLPSVDSIARALQLSR